MLFIMHVWYLYEDNSRKMFIQIKHTRFYRKFLPLCKICCPMCKICFPVCGAGCETSAVDGQRFAVLSQGTAGGKRSEKIKKPTINAGC